MPNTSYKSARHDIQGFHIGMHVSVLQLRAADSQSRMYDAKVSPRLSPANPLLQVHVQVLQRCRRSQGWRHSCKVVLRQV